MPPWMWERLSDFTLLEAKTYSRGLVCPEIPVYSLPVKAAKTKAKRVVSAGHTYCVTAITAPVCASRVMCLVEAL
jgi:hypothetical protein